MPSPRAVNWGKITEDSLRVLLERKDVPRRRRGSMSRRDDRTDEATGSRTPDDSGDYTRISRELAGRYSRAIADVNPLYRDRKYAEQSIWGRLIVPPGVLAWTEQVNGATDGFPGCHTIWRGCELEWERPIFVGERVYSTTYLRDARIVESGFGGGIAAVQDYETIAEDADGRTIGWYRTSWHRFERGGAKEAKKYVEMERPQWTDEDLDAIRDEYHRQNFAHHRGADPLFWEDVEEGVEIPYILKGPTTLTSKLAFESLGWPGGWVVGHELAIDLFERYPALPIRNEENVPEPPVAIHWTNERAQKHLGMPAAYEAGYERLNWFTQLIMSWMGDHGMLRKLSMQFKGFHWQGDLIRLHARVTDSEVVDDRHLVHLAIDTVTQRGEVTTEGAATVELPARATGRPVWTAEG